MTSKVEWLVEHRIILTTLSGLVRGADVPAFDQLINSHLDESPAKMVHYIGNVSALEKGPSFSEVRSFTFMKHPRFGWGIQVNAKGYLIARMITTLLTRLNNTPFREFTTMDEALNFLQSVDESLPDLHNIR